MPSSGLYKVLRDITCVHIENSKVVSCQYHSFSTLSDFTVWRNSQVTGWRDDSLFSCLQIPYIESLVRDRSDHMDWRRLLLSAALPWPSPSMTQLLAALEGFKAVDSDLTGYVNEEEYLQVFDATQLSMMLFQNHCFVLRKYGRSCSMYRWNYGSVTAARKLSKTPRKCHRIKDLLNYRR